MIIFHVHTGTTLLNILNLKANQLSSEISDIYISNSSRMPPELIQFTRDSNLFRNVIVINQPWKNISERHNITSKVGFLLCKIISLLQLQKYHSSIISQQIRSDDKCETLITYGLWGMSPYIVNYFYRRNNHLTIHIMDEGIGTESTSFQTLTNPKRTDVFKNRFSRIAYDFIWFIDTGNLLNHDIERFRQCFTDYYLYHPKKSQLYLETSLTPHRLLPFDTNNKLTPLLQELLDGIDYEVYLQRDVWILSDYDVQEAHPSHSTFIRILDTIISSCTQNNVIIKGHPVLSLSEEYYSLLYPEIYIDNRKYQLEALYSQIDLNDKILITRVSSAVFYPKYMFNAEPYIIFTYKLSPKNVNNDAMDKLVASLKELYINPLKIHIPHSYDDMRDFIRAIS